MSDFRNGSIMKKLRLLGVMLFAALPVVLIGCGGGGGNGPSVSATATPRATPRATATPVAGSRILVVQLRDNAKQAVDGIVTVGSSTLATSEGSATFRGVAAGTLSVKAEVDGVVTTRSATVPSAAGTTFLTFTITPSVTPVATATLPPPPF